MVSDPSHSGIIDAFHSILVSLWRMTFEPKAAKLAVSRLKARKCMFVTFVKTEVTTTSAQTCMAIPRALRNRLDFGRQAERMVT